MVRVKAPKASALGLLFVPMFWTNSKVEKEPERFYLLPGMGGRAYRRKQKFILQSSVVVGLLVSLLIALVLYLLNRS